MEANPNFARGRVVFGSSKMSVEEQWNVLTKNLNSFGPPIRSITEWKKSWADLKSRTKRKVAENKRSLTETGGGLFRMNPLTELEQVVDRTCFLSKATAPSGSVFGAKTTELIDDCSVALTVTPPRISKAVVVAVTPSRQKTTSSNQGPSTEIHKQIVAVKLLQHQDITKFPASNRYTGVVTPTRRIETLSNQEASTQQQLDMWPPHNYSQQQKRQLDMSDEPSISSSSKKEKENP